MAIDGSAGLAGHGKIFVKAAYPLEGLQPNRSFRGAFPAANNGRAHERDSNIFDSAARRRISGFQISNFRKRGRL
jgi:hypothetical protein